jgi:methylmalonyl-CoA mutase
LRIAADVVEYLAEAVPRFNALSVSGYHFQEAGADPVLELALTMANARTYVDTLVRRGMRADEVCERMSFFFGVGTDFYVEVAKLRAARLLWSELKLQSGASTQNARALRMQCQTSGWSLTAHKPLNNVVRTTVEAVVAIFGGTQSLHTNAYDEALALPTAQSARLARDTQLVLQHETGVCDVVDPWAGSYMMEALTADIASRARALLKEIGMHDGAVEAIRSGWVRQRIHESVLRVQAEIDSGQRAVVGVNRFVADDKNECIESRTLDAREVRRQPALRITQVRATRDRHRVRKALDALGRAAHDGEGNLLELTIECMRARATVGDCTKVLEGVWPRQLIELRSEEGIISEILSSDADWQAACENVALATLELGRAPRILVTKLGQDGHDRGALVVASALTDAGFDVVPGAMFMSPAEVCIQAIELDVNAIGISSLAGAHEELTSLLIAELRKQNVDIPIVVGGNIDDGSQVALKSLGVVDCFPTGTSICNIVSRLAGLCRQTVRGRRESAELAAVQH